MRLDEETGEILVRAPFAARGYVGDEELSAATFLLEADDVLVFTLGPLDRLRAAEVNVE